jgi:hypothetical protein
VVMEFVQVGVVRNLGFQVRKVKLGLSSWGCHFWVFMSGRVGRGWNLLVCIL